MEQEELNGMFGILHSPFSILNSSVPVEQSGVLATLSRWRSWVQIPSGTLGGTVRKPAKRPSSNLGDRLWVRFPPVLLQARVGWALASPSGCNPPASGCAGSTPARRTG